MMAKKDWRNEEYILENTETGEKKKWKLSAILRDINRDRSGEWQNYNKDDWKEGLREFTEYKLIRKVK